MIFRRRRTPEPDPQPLPPILVVEPEVPWEPGIPLYERGAQGSGDSYRMQIFTFRVDSELEDDCHCGDAASWPEPHGSRALTELDDLGEFIAGARAAVSA